MCTCDSSGDIHVVIGKPEAIVHIPKQLATHERWLLSIH